MQFVEYCHSNECIFAVPVVEGCHCPLELVEMLQRKYKHLEFLVSVSTGRTNRYDVHAKFKLPKEFKPSDGDLMRMTKHELTNELNVIEEEFKTISATVFNVMSIYSYAEACNISLVTIVDLRDQLEHASVRIR